MLRQNYDELYKQKEAYKDEVLRLRAELHRLKKAAAADLQ